MKRKILAFLLAFAMCVSLATVFANATPYVPPATAWKDFGQGQLYINEVKAGYAAPRADGFVTEGDGYGEPVAVYSLRYCTTADKVVYDENMMPLPEYKMRNDGEHAGEFYVYPTPYSSDAVWKSISTLETTSDSCYVFTQYYPVTSPTATGTYYYYSPYTLSFVRNYPAGGTSGTWTTEDASGCYVYNSSGTIQSQYSILREKPADWETAVNATASTKYYTLNYSADAVTRTFVTIKLVDGEMPEFRANTYWKIDYRYRKLTEKPADWDNITSNSKYYYDSNAGQKELIAMEQNDEGKNVMPEFVANQYYIYEAVPRYASALYASAEGNTSQSASVTRLKTYHVVLPEEVRIYARYDNNYVYEAVEIDEPAHRTAAYYADLRYSSEMSGMMGRMAMNNSFSFGIHRTLDGSAARVIKSTLVRTYITASTAVSTDGYNAVLRKFGNNDATSISDVLKVGSGYNVTHQTYEQTHAEAAPDPDTEPGYEEEEDDVSSGTYGTTTYEWRLPWKVVNDNYNPYRDATPVPYAFSSLQFFQLDNTIGRGCYSFSPSLPRDTRQLPGSISASSSGNYSKTLYAMRYPSKTGLPAGQYRFLWANYSSGYNALSNEYAVTDYKSVSDLFATGSSYTWPMIYTAGQETDEDHPQPEIIGTQIRTDDTEGQGFRLKVKVPQYTADIEEIGVIMAPTEVQRRGPLTLGMEEIAYRAENYPEYYGIVPNTDENGEVILNENGEVAGYHWMNLPEDSDKYFAANATPADADSFYSQDVFGGKVSGIYTVNTLKCDTTEPYETNRTYKYNAYTCEYVGLYDDFDDFYTFYTFRPYIKYADGTLVYGPYEYKSIYYIACWSIEEFIDSINGTVGSDAGNRYTMDQMNKVAAKDADGNTLTDEKGNTVYVDNTATTSSMSPYYGAAEHSIYIPEERDVVFRTNAIRVLNRVNKTQYRLKDYDTTPDDFKALVDEYVEYYETIWKCIEGCEAKVYLEDHRN